MWGYRLEKADKTIALTWPSSVIFDRIDKLRNVALTTTFEREAKHAKQIAKALGWDGTFVAEPECFSLPMPDSSMAWGFIITQATSGERYVSSPVPLKYIEDTCDHDAMINDEEVLKIKAQLTGEHPPEPVVEVGDWMRSRAGNYYTHINGTNVTIIKSNRGDGFKAVIPIHADAKKNIYTKTFKTEMEVARYVTDNFNTLIASLRREAEIIPADSPLAGVNWGDPDDDIPF